MILKHLHLAILEYRFLTKTSKERIDSKKVLESSQNIKGKIVRSMKCNSIISPFLGRWQNLNWITKTQRMSHKNNCNEKNELYFIKVKHTICTWITNKDYKLYIKKYKSVLSLLPLLVNRTRKGERREKNQRREEVQALLQR